jgi:hypothetical protein
MLRTIIIVFLLATMLMFNSNMSFGKEKLLVFSGEVADVMVEVKGIRMGVTGTYPEPIGGQFIILLKNSPNKEFSVDYKGIKECGLPKVGEKVKLKCVKSDSVSSKIEQYKIMDCKKPE